MYVFSPSLALGAMRVFSRLCARLEPSRAVAPLPKFPRARALTEPCLRSRIDQHPLRPLTATPLHCSRLLRLLKHVEHRKYLTVRILWNNFMVLERPG